MIRDEQQGAMQREERELRTALRQASLDAPQVDLWPRLADDVAGLARAQARQRRRFVAIRQVRTLLAAALSLTLIAGLLGGAWHLFSTRSASAVPTRGDVADQLLLLDNRAGNDPSVSSVTAYQPFAATRERLLDGVIGLPIVAPDGRQVFFLTQAHSGGEIRTALVARGDEPLKQQWTVQIAAQSEDEAVKQPFIFRVAVAAGRVYLVAWHWQSPDSLLVRSLDRATGQERDRWPVEIGGAAIDDIGLYSAPDERQLHLFASLVATGSTAPRLQEIHVRFQLLDGRQERQELTTANPPTTFLYGQGSRVTPDGRTLYRLTFDGRLNFFDLQNGTSPAVLPPLFASAPGEAPLPMGQVPSHDGRTLYVVAPTRGEVAIVDLIDRRVERIVQLGGTTASVPQPGFGARLWHALRGLLVEDASANNNFTAVPQLSPDGHWLYATGATGIGAQARVGGIWVIDTAAWQVTAHWQPEVAFTPLLLGGDGHYLYAQRDDRLVAFDTRAGLEVFTSPDPIGTPYSLAELYRDRYGRSAAVDGVRPRDGR
jgi:hypothetical protein